MPTPSWSKTVSASPKFAPADYASLPARVSRFPETDLHLNVWHGSGFQLSELPCYPHGPDYFFAYVQECGRCESKNIVVVYLCNWYDQSGADIDLELECKSCGAFTQYKGWA